MAQHFRRTKVGRADEPAVRRRRTICAAVAKGPEGTAKTDLLRRRSIDTERTLIVAFSGTHTPGKLPPIWYLSGGLESAEMRKHVCDILEVGDRAFKERARRLRVRLDR